MFAEVHAFYGTIALIGLIAYLIEQEYATAVVCAAIVLTAIVGVMVCRFGSR